MCLSVEPFHQIWNRHFGKLWRHIILLKRLLVAVANSDLVMNSAWFRSLVPQNDSNLLLEHFLSDGDGIRILISQVVVDQNQVARQVFQNFVGENEELLEAELRQLVGGCLDCEVLKENVFGYLKPRWTE